MIDKEAILEEANDIANEQASSMELVFDMTVDSLLAQLRLRRQTYLEASNYISAATIEKLLVELNNV